MCAGRAPASCSLRVLLRPGARGEDEPGFVGEGVSLDVSTELKAHFRWSEEDRFPLCTPFPPEFVPVGAAERGAANRGPGLVARGEQGDRATSTWTCRAASAPASRSTSSTSTTATRRAPTRRWTWTRRGSPSGAAASRSRPLTGQLVLRPRRQGPQVRAPAVPADRDLRPRLDRVQPLPRPAAPGGRLDRRPRLLLRPGLERQPDLHARPERPGRRQRHGAPPPNPTSSSTRASRSSTTPRSRTWSSTTSFEYGGGAGVRFVSEDQQRGRRRPRLLLPHPPLGAGPAQRHLLPGRPRAAGGERASRRPARGRQARPSTGRTSTCASGGFSAFRPVRQGGVGEPAPHGLRGRGRLPLGLGDLGDPRAPLSRDRARRPLQPSRQRLDRAPGASSP